MLGEFSRFLKTRDLCSDEHRVLLGVSGGIDSMVMSDLFLRAGCKVGIAHCNFQLRGNESDGDESFVKDFAESKGVPFHAIRFDTEAYARDNGSSIQMAARDLRRDWMEKIAVQHDYDRIALAHHQDDEAETFFLNLVRGTGIAGLGGIRPRSGITIRPMLFTGREAIGLYAAEMGIEYRTDSSNLKTDYARNRIRHNILPELERINPGFSKVLSRDMKYIRSMGSILHQHFDTLWEMHSRATDRGMELDLEWLRELPEKETYLFEFLRPYGFNSSDADQIGAALEGQPGKKFTSARHRLFIDRHTLIISKIENKPESRDEYLIGEGTSRIDTPVELTFRIIGRKEGYSIPGDPCIAHLDADSLEYPLKLRRWQEGDRFVPLGMKGHKLLSDYFTDIKLSAVEKENAWILQSGREIIWIIGYRISDHCKVMEETRSILEIRHTNN